MKKLLILFSFVALQLTNLLGSYGQAPKQGVIPFLKEIIIQFPNVRDVTMTKDENEIYFTVQSYLGELSAIVHVIKRDGVWSNPQVANFSGRFQDMEPFLSADGLKLYFVSNRPLSNEEQKPKDFDIWYVERKNLNSNWSIPVNLGEPVNTKGNEFYPSLANSGNLYFTSDGELSKGKDDIFLSKYRNGKYEPPFSMNDSINSEGYEFNSFIDPEEKFIIYTCYNKKGGLGSGDLYISYHKGNDEWTTCKNLGNEINSTEMDYCPYVNPKSGKLHFTSKRSAVPDTFNEPLNFDSMREEMNKYENGLSRLYSVKIEKMLNGVFQK